MAKEEPKKRKHYFPLVGAGVAILPALRTVSDMGGIPGTINTLVNDPARVVDGLVNNYTGAQSDGNINGAKLTATAVPILVYLGLRKVAGRKLDNIMHRFGVAF